MNAIATFREIVAIDSGIVYEMQGLSAKFSLATFFRFFRYSIQANQSPCSLLPAEVITPTLEVLRQVDFLLIIVKFSL